MIIVGASPFSACIIIIVTFSVAVMAASHFHSLGKGFGVPSLHNPCGAMLDRGMEEYAEHPRVVTQDIVGCPPHNHARSLLAELLYGHTLLLIKSRAPDGDVVIILSDAIHSLKE